MVLLKLVAAHLYLLLENKMGSFGGKAKALSPSEIMANKTSEEINQKKQAAAEMAATEMAQTASKANMLKPANYAPAQNQRKFAATELEERTSKKFLMGI
jgi:hypothetical protein